MASPAEFAFADLGSGYSPTIGPYELQRERWAFLNSGIRDYDSYSGFNDLRTQLAEHLGKFSTNIALDLAGGPRGRALGDLISAGAIDGGLVTNYSDPRKILTKFDHFIHKIGYIDGDLTHADTWREISMWQRRQAPEGFSLIMHRPVGALQEAPKDFYIAATNALLDMLRRGGVLFAQVPEPLITANPSGSGCRVDKEMYLSLAERGDIEHAKITRLQKYIPGFRPPHVLLIKS